MREYEGNESLPFMKTQISNCACGRVHRSSVQYCRIGRNVIQNLPEALAKLNSKKPYVICGPNAYEAAGKKVCSILDSNDIPYGIHVIRSQGNEKLKPDEYTVGSALMHFPHDSDLILAVGSGVMNDVAKLLGASLGKSCFIVATAPSMDGFASDGASLEVDGIKSSLCEQAPSAILCDTAIMRNAPIRMLHAGIGDMLAKYSALAGWKLAKLIVDEYYCEEVAGIMSGTLKKVIECEKDVVQRDEEAIKRLAEGLVMSGVAMEYAGCSYPASGQEHYFSHCWEMMKLERGEEYDLHGVQVGIGLLITLRIMERLKKEKPSIERVAAATEKFDSRRWEANIIRVFPKSSEQLIHMAKIARKNTAKGRILRAEKIINNWDEVLKILDEVPSFQEVEDRMRETGIPTMPAEIGITGQDVIDAFVCSRDIRNKYLLSSMIWDLGYMEEYSDWLSEVYS